MEKKGSERRTCPRTKLRTSLRYQIRGCPDYSNAICDDISLAGIGFINNEFLSPDTLVSLEISVMSKVLRALGKIAWSQPLPHSNRFKVGVRFLEFDLADKHYLTDYIRLQLNQL